MKNTTTNTKIKFSKRIGREPSCLIQIQSNCNRKGGKFGKITCNGHRNAEKFSSL